MPDPKDPKNAPGSGRASPAPREVTFLGWQENSGADMFPLYTIRKTGHPLYLSTVTEETLRSLQLPVPPTPSPYPEAGLSPWHNLGTKLVNPATAREAVTAAGLDYTVIKIPWKQIPERYRTGGSPDAWAAFRTDTGAVLGIIGENDEPVQNRDAFAFFDPLVAAGKASYTAAGIFGNGERLWMLARLHGFMNVHGNDIIGRYLLLSHCHSQCQGTQVKLAPVRLVCYNTLAAPVRERGESSIRYSAPSARDWADSLLELAYARYDQLDTTFNRLAGKKINDQQLLDFLVDLMPDTGDETEGMKNRNVRAACLASYRTSHGADLSRGTLWGALNSVADYTDHKMDGHPSARLKSLWFGEGEQLKLKALQIAEQMM